jgi:hypothetical protein
MSYNIQGQNPAYNPLLLQQYPYSTQQTSNYFPPTNIPIPGQVQSPLLVDLFFPANGRPQAGQQFPLTQGGIGVPNGAPEEGGSSTWKKVAVGATVLAGLGAVAYGKGWWPFNSSTNENEESGNTDDTHTERSGSRNQGNETSKLDEQQHKHKTESSEETELLQHQRQEEADRRAYTEKLLPAYEQYIAALDQQIQLSQLEKLGQEEESRRKAGEQLEAVKKRVAETAQRLREAEETYDSTAQTTIADTAILNNKTEIATRLKDLEQVEGNGLTVAEDQELDQRLQPAYTTLLQALDHQRETLQTKFSEEEAVRRAEERVLKATEELMQAKQYKGGAWSTKPQETLIKQKQAEIQTIIADETQKKINGLTVEQNKAIGIRLRTAYDRVDQVLRESSDQEQTVREAFEALKNARNFAGSNSWQQEKRETAMVEPLKQYKSQHAEAYGKLLAEKLIQKETAEAVG